MIRKEKFRRIGVASVVGCLLVGLTAGCGTEKTDVSQKMESVGMMYNEGDDFAGAVGTKVNVEDGYDGYLGYGYDVLHSRYFNGEDVSMEAEVLDMDKVLMDGLIYTADMKKTNSFVNVYESSEKYYGALAERCSLEAYNIEMAFAGEREILDSVFVKGNKQYVWTSDEVRTGREYIRGASDRRMASYLTAEFVADAEELSPRELLEKYGSFVLTDIQLGGSFNVFQVSKKEIYAETQIEAIWAWLFSKNTIDDETVDGGNTTDHNSEIIEVDENIEDVAEEYLLEYNIENRFDIQYFGGDTSIDGTDINSALEKLEEWEESVLGGADEFVDCTGAIPLWDLVAQITTPEQGQEVQIAFMEMYLDILR